MTVRLVLGASFLALTLAGCTAQAESQLPASPAQIAQRATLPDLPPGSNERLRQALAGADGLEVIVSDVVIPPGGRVPRHFHPGEEFVYVLEGSAIHEQDGKPDRELVAGDAMVIEPRAVHSPRGGPDGARAVVFRVHVEGEPERIRVPE